MPVLNDLLATNVATAGSLNDKLIAYFSGIYRGSGSPEGVTDAPLGSTFMDVTTPAMYVKTTATGTLTGWQAVPFGTTSPLWPAWTPVLGGVGFQNSWVNAGGHPVAAYRKSNDGKHVELVGGVNGGAAGSVVFTLPAGFRPTTLQMWTNANASTLTSQVVDVDTAGLVKIFGGVAANNQRIDGTFSLDSV